MTGPGSFAKLGLGTLNLNVPQSHLGGTVVAQGVLNNGIANALPTNGPLVVGNPLVNENTAVYALNGFDQTVASLSLVAKASGGPAARLVLGGNTLTVNGTLALIDNAGAPGNAFPVTVSSTAGGNINLGGAVRDLNVAGNNNASGDLLINAPITNGGINYTGTNSTTVAGIPARLSFGGTNTYAGGTTINSGTLIVTAAATLADPTGALTVNTTGPVGTNSLLTLNSSQTVGSLAGSVSGGGTATINFAAAGTLTVNQNINTTYAGVLSGASGALNKSGTGTLTLSGTNTYGGGTQVNAGRLNVNNTSGSGTGTGAVAVNGGTLGGTGSIGGAVTVNSGTLAPGLSPGILTINSNLTFTGGTFEVELQGLTPGTQYDQVVVTGTGNVNLGAGVANISVLPSGYTPALSDVFVVINNTGTGTLSGIFNGLPDQSVVASNVLGSGIDYLIWYGSYTGFSTSVVIAPIPEPATVLGICAVGFGAARMIRRRFKKTTTAA
jgi:autotransporter-associated beta strand protein